MPTLPEIISFLEILQDEICNSLENQDQKEKFKEDKWDRPEGGGGKTRVIAYGNVIEKGGVNFSHVWGKLPEKTALGLGITPGMEFHATGLSLVIHPLSPKIPITHMNIRYFETGDGKYWFGGGIDLTPIYVDEENAKDFHQVLKSTCDGFNPEYYPRFKAECDRYFWLPHRGEMRGIGGIFFDYLSAETDTEKENLYSFWREIGNSFIPAYLPIVTGKKNLTWSESEKRFQLIRRSRYAEFNLVYDRGTKFGLETGGRTESILMSLPPQASWEYNYKADSGSAEEKTISLLQPIDWVNAVLSK